MKALAVSNESFLHSSIDLLVQNLFSDEVRVFFKRQKLDLSKQKLENLIKALRTINDGLVDEVEKQTDVEAVNWLNEVKNAVYAAEDFWEEIYDEAGKSVSESDCKTCSGKVLKVCPCLDPCLPCAPSSFSEHQIAVKGRNLERIIEKLVELGRNTPSPTRERPQPESFPTLQPDDCPVYFRDDSKKAILDLLQPDEMVKNIEVITIEGIQDIGKTALANLVYHDVEVQKWFDQKAWVTALEELDALNLMEMILGDIVPTSTTTADQLSDLSDKKLLLVLDDVRTCHHAQWDLLLNQLSSTAQGSKIIITTSNPTIKSVVQSTPYHMPKMSDDDCWILFFKYGGGEDGSIDSNFEQLYRSEVVRRCGGLPGNARQLGTLLRSIGFEGWKKKFDINPQAVPNRERDLDALRIKYSQLSPRLKDCFAFCAVLPQNYLFTKEELVLLWMAEGLLVHPTGEKGIKQVGYEFFEELVSMSFFRQAGDHPAYFLVHDIAADLASYLSWEFSMSLGDDDDSREISSNTRHLSFVCTRYADLKKHRGIGNVLNLRSFLSVSKERSGDGFDDKEFNNLLASFKHLRVLSLSNIFELPYLIGNIKYLSYLNLSEASIRELPESVCLLYNLQILILHQCQHLVKLPTDLKKLINLHHVDIGNTSLREMPPQMGELWKLQKLTDFFVAKQNVYDIKGKGKRRHGFKSNIKEKQNGSGINELGNLNLLEGELRIWNLQNVGKDVAAPLKEKGKLQKLELRWSGDVNDGYEQEQWVLERLQPHQDVEVLAIYGFGGQRFPGWLGNSSFSKIVQLRLSGCRNCLSLPPLGHLESLKELLIKEFPGLEVVGPEFYGSHGSDQIPFKSLESLTFDTMLRWHEWRYLADQDETGAFPSLQMLHIRKCPQLKLSLQRSLTKVKKIQLSDDLHSVKLEKLPSDLHSLTVDSFHSLDSILEQIKPLGCSPSTLEKIEITSVPLEIFQLETYPQLKQLRIRKCPYLESIRAPEIRRDYSKPSTSWSGLHCLEELILESCRNLRPLSLELVRSIPHQKFIYEDCPKL